MISWLFPSIHFNILIVFFPPKNLHAIFCRGHQGQEQLCNSDVLEKVKWKHYDFFFFTALVYATLG